MTHRIATYYSLEDLAELRLSLLAQAAELDRTIADLECAIDLIKIGDELDMENTR